MKYPSKQGPYETAVAAYLRHALPLDRYPFVSQLGRTDVTLRFTPDGAVRTNTKRTPGTTKSVDFAIAHDDGETLTVFLTTHKFTRVAGGHQDNQWEDVVQLVAAATRCIISGNTELLLEALPKLGIVAEGRAIHFEPVALLDGDFFTGKVVPVPAVIQGDTDHVLAYLQTFVPRVWPPVEHLPPEAIDALA
jgi:hypothetical protein